MSEDRPAESPAWGEPPPPPQPLEPPVPAAPPPPPESGDGAFVPAGQGFAPPPVTPPHPHDFYAAHMSGPRPAAAMPPAPPPPGYGAPGYGGPYPGYGVPGYGAPGYGMPGQPFSPGYGVPRPFPLAKPYSGRAIASLVMGIANFMFLITAPVVAPIGFIVGWLALKETRDDGPRQGRGLAVGGMAINGVALLVCVVVGLAIGGAIFAAEKERQQRQERWVESDFDTIRARLQIYYERNNNSLGPGGPVLATNSIRYDYSNRAPREEGKVAGTLSLRHLVTEVDLLGSVSEFTLTITGTASAVVRHNPSGREMRVIDIGSDNYTITPRP